MFVEAHFVAWRIATERDESGERRLVARSEREAVVVARNLQDVHFSYRAVDGSWASRWDGSLGLPALVRLRLVPQFPAAGAPPDLVVAPRLREARAEP